MGEVIGGRYELLDVIGQGGMGTVWRARDVRSGDEIAAKVLRQSDAGSILRFVRETGFRIHHPHVLVPLGWVGEDDRVVLAMPLIDGGSVATLVGDYGALPPLVVAELLRQLCSGLDAVHRAGVVHRDLKPANLLLRATGAGRPDLLLTDFGIATPVEGPRLTAADFVLGTPGYLAPEQVSGADPDPRQDLFAAGMVAREMLSGERPRAAAGRLPVIPAARPHGVPDALWQLVEGLTRLDPAKRPPSAAACVDALEVPGLAWRPDAIGEVEVLDQLSATTADEPGTTRAAPATTATTRADPAPTTGPTAAQPAPAQTQPVVSVQTQPAPAQPSDGPGMPQMASLRRDGPPLNGAVPLILVAIVIVGLLVALVSWHPWSAVVAPSSVLRGAVHLLTDDG